MDGSLVSREAFYMAKKFVSEVMESLRVNLPSAYPEKRSELGEFFEQKMKMHDLYDQLHDSHLRIIHWHLACLEFEYQSTILEIVEKPPKKRQLIVPGGLGQLPHGLAYGYDDKYYQLDINCGKMIEGICFNSNNEIELSCGESKFTASYAVGLVVLPSRSLQCLLKYFQVHSHLV